ncbi:rod shape-determining protein MreC [Acetobacter sacchari]|uniref:Cell shape-determining protein MreC n=1 Tax=Acetobacter sacchari TaxID=2661687 RepID=A0ABS3LZ22_9PROT|nr:rod shape-determining protein MreC [Acetobacter sacchari]MBO1361165.1 rod shape-determining protein MreC [Acetobacter sacchari]
MIPVSIQARQALDKLLLPFMLLIAVGVILLGQADRNLTHAARMLVADVLSPIWSLIAEPGERVAAAVAEIRGINHLAEENASLRAENETLRGWYDVAVSLTQENQTLKNNLRWMPDPVPSFVTGRVIADAGGLYSHAVLIGAGPQSGVRVGNVALAADGFAGRVTETGQRSARILLINDLSSRIPVTLEASHGSAIMTGDNSSSPRLMYYAQDNHPIEGERVVTSGQANLLPAGLPIGVVHYARAGQPVVTPYARLDHLSILRIFDFEVASIDAPDAPGRVPLAPLHAGAGPNGALPGTSARDGDSGDGTTLSGATLGGVIGIRPHERDEKSMSKASNQTDNTDETQDSDDTAHARQGATPDAQAPDAPNADPSLSGRKKAQSPSPAYPPPFTERG